MAALAGGWAGTRSPAARAAQGRPRHRLVTGRPVSHGDPPGRFAQPVVASDCGWPAERTGTEIDKVSPRWSVMDPDAGGLPGLGFASRTEGAHIIAAFSGRT
jgi:hypothetical protein